MSLSEGLYVGGDSWLHRLDPRVKLAFALLSTAALMSLGSLPLFVLFLVLCHAGLLSARLPLTRLAWAWRLMLPITIMIPVLWPLFSTTAGPSLLQLGPLTVTWPDIWQGLAMAARIDAMAFAFFVWLFTTDQTDMVLGFVSLGVPYEWGLTLTITLRYIPALQVAFEQVMDAQRARGLVISHTNPVRAARAYIPVLVPTLVTALRAAETLSRALEARAFGAPGRRRTIRRRLQFTLVDGLVLGVIVTAFGGVITARILWGIGTGPLLL
jgi:energy-coupling factor transport system permease protein